MEEPGEEEVMFYELDSESHDLTALLSQKGRSQRIQVQPQGLNVGKVVVQSMRTMCLQVKNF
jgi:hypothetical protein